MGYAWSGLGCGEYFPDDTHRLTFFAHCGVTFPIAVGTLEDIRRIAAKRIRKYRSYGSTISTLKKGREWEVLDPEDSVMVSDDCGTLCIDEIPKPEEPEYDDDFEEIPDEDL